jgi:hypothetical protein
MGFFDLIGDIVSLPVSIAKDAVGWKPSNGTNTGKNIEEIIDDLTGWM